MDVARADRILTTHTGSLPRPRALTRLHAARSKGGTVDAAALAAESRAAVHSILPKQLAAGIDIPNDGEQGRESFVLYLRDRLTGLGGESRRPPFADIEAYPEFKQALLDSLSGKETASVTGNLPAATGPRLCRPVGDGPEIAETGRAGPVRPRAAGCLHGRSLPGIVAAVVQKRHTTPRSAYLAALAAALPPNTPTCMPAHLQDYSPDLAGNATAPGRTGRWPISSASANASSPRINGVVPTCRAIASACMAAGELRGAARCHVPFEPRPRSAPPPVPAKALAPREHRCAAAAPGRGPVLGSPWRVC